MMDEKNLNENEINEEFEEEDLGKTQEIDSLFSENNSRSITPRDEFIELNSADDMSKTLRLFSSISRTRVYLLSRMPLTSDCLCRRN